MKERGHALRSVVASSGDHNLRSWVGVISNFRGVLGTGKVLPG